MEFKGVPRGFRVFSGLSWVMQEVSGTSHGVPGEFNGVQRHVLEFQESFRVSRDFQGLTEGPRRFQGLTRTFLVVSEGFQLSSGLSSMLQRCLRGFRSVSEFQWVPKPFQGFLMAFQGCSRGTQEISGAAKDVSGCSKGFQRSCTRFQKVSGRFRESRRLQELTGTFHEVSGDFREVPRSFRVFPWLFRGDSGDFRDFP